MHQVFFVCSLFRFLGPSEDCLNIGERRVDFRVLEFIVLVKGAFRAVGLPTGLDSALIKPLDLMCISSEPFGLLVSLKGTVTLFILI